MSQNIGIAIAQRLTYLLVGKGLNYNDLSEIVYGAFNQISKETNIGDWIELPNGDTFTKTFQIKKEN